MAVCDVLVEDRERVVDHRAVARQDGPQLVRLGQPVQPVAKLLDESGAVIGGGGLRHHEWLMLLGGQVVATTGSAAMLLAMLRHTQALVRQTRPLTLEAAPQLLHAAAVEAQSLGHTLEEYLAVLEQERAARSTEPEAS